MRFLLLLLSCLLFLSCQKEKDENEYFYKITNELSPINDSPEKISPIYKRELEQFKKTGNEKYLISAKYVQIFLHQDNDYKQIPLLFELLALNDNKYVFISMACNFSLSLKLEHNSPKLAMQLIDNAIADDQKMKRNYFIAHLYHAKGRFYYNEKKYSKALLYFRKALQKLKPEQKLYVASMFNNFGLVYDKSGRTDLAVKEVQKGIGILSAKDSLTGEETKFLNAMKDNLGLYLYKEKEYSAAEKLLLQQFEYYKSQKKYNSLAVAAYSSLFDLYSKTGQKEQQRMVIDHLLSIEPFLTKTDDKITLNEIVQNYYADNDDMPQLKATAEKLVALNRAFDNDNSKSIREITDHLNNMIIQNITNKYYYEIQTEKRKSFLYIGLAVVSIIILVLVIFNIKSAVKKEREIAKKQKEISENNRRILKQNISLQNEKSRTCTRTLT